MTSEPNLTCGPLQARVAIAQLGRALGPDRLALADRLRHRHVGADSGKRSHPASPSAEWPEEPASSICVPVSSSTPTVPARAPRAARAPSRSTSIARLGRDLLGERGRELVQLMGEIVRAAAVAHVAGDHGRALDRAVLSENRRDGQRDHQNAPVLGDPLGLVVVHALAGEHAGEDVELLAGPVVRDQYRDRPGRRPPPPCTRTCSSRPGSSS